MSSFSGAVIGREQVTRRCGCVVEFLHYESDPFRAARKQKMQQKRCPPCGKKASDTFSAQQSADAAARRDLERTKRQERVAEAEARAKELRIERDAVKIVEHEEQAARAKREPGKARVTFEPLPPGTVLTVEKLPSGTWLGVLAVPGHAGIERRAGSPIGLVFKLAEVFARAQAEGKVPA